MRGNSTAFYDIIPTGYRLVVRNRTPEYMARPVVGNKLGDIRNAAVLEVVDNGVAHASINRIASRAGLSVGTIYRYYKSKDDLFRAIYIEIKTDLHQTIMLAQQDHRTSRERIKAVWFAMLDFAHTHPGDFLFSERISNELVLNQSESLTLDKMKNELVQIIESAIDDGTLRRGTARIHILVLSAPAIQLARAAAMKGLTVDQHEAGETFELLWKAVAKD